MIQALFSVAVGAWIGWLAYRMRHAEDRIAALEAHLGESGRDEPERDAGGEAVRIPDPPSAGFAAGLMLGAIFGALAACLCGLVPFP